jgi:type II secretory pathway pseudopilin PulG
MRGEEQKQGGFTIIEVILFLAITALLLTIALIGTGGSIQAGRFTDSVRTTESHVQKQFSDVLNGVNPRASNLTCDNSGNVTESGSGTPVGRTNCVLMGRLMAFTNGQSEFTVRPVVGVAPSSFTDTSNMTDFELIHNYNPRVVMVPSSQEPIKIPWEASVLGVKRSDNQTVSAVAILRSPRSSSMLTYAFNWNGDSNITTPVAASGNLLQDKTVNICLQSADSGTLAAVVVGGGQGQAATNTDFQITQPACQ